MVHPNTQSPALDEPMRRLIELNRSSQAVPAGLRAAAEEFPSQRIKKAFYRLAERVEAGGSPDGFSPTDLEALVAAAAVECLDERDESDKTDGGNGDDVQDRIVSIGGRMAAWMAEERFLSAVRRRLLLNLWLALGLLFFGGLANYAMVQFVQIPVREMIAEFELTQSDEELLFYDVVAWIGPSIMGLALVCATILLLSIFGPFRGLAERIVFSTPLAGNALRRLHLTTMCEGIASGLAAGATYPKALTHALTLTRSGVLRTWLRKAALVVEQGADLVDAIGYLPVQGEILPAMVGRVGPEPERPWVGWRMAGEYFRNGGIRGAESSRFLLPLFSLFAAMLGWLGMAVALGPLVSLISSLGGM